SSEIGSRLYRARTSAGSLSASRPLGRQIIQKRSQRGIVRVTPFRARRRGGNDPGALDIMRAIVQDKYGPSPDVLELREIDKPVEGVEDVLVRVHAAGVDH